MKHFPYRRRGASLCLLGLILAADAAGPGCGGKSEPGSDAATDAPASPTTDAEVEAATADAWAEGATPECKDASVSQNGAASANKKTSLDGADSTEDAGENCGCGSGPFSVEIEGAPDELGLQTFTFPGPLPGQLRETADAGSSCAEHDADVEEPFHCATSGDPRVYSLACEPPPVPWAVEQTGAISRLVFVSACGDATGSGPCIAIQSPYAYPMGKSVYRHRSGRIYKFQVDILTGGAPFSSKLKGTVTGTFSGTFESGRKISGRFGTCLLLYCSVP